MKRALYSYLTLAAAILIGNHNGFIALWRNPGPQPDIVFPYRVASLPLADQESVNRGIQIRSEAELQALLEDFLS